MTRVSDPCPLRLVNPAEWEEVTTEDQLSDCDGQMIGWALAATFAGTMLAAIDFLA